MGAKRLRGIAADPLAPLAGMVLAAMLLLGSAGDEQASERTLEEATRLPTALSSAVGKTYTPRLVAGGPPEGSDHEAAAPACAASEARVSYRVAALPLEGAGT